MCRPCWKQRSAVWHWRGADDERTRTAAHRPGAGGGGQIRCRPPSHLTDAMTPADRRLWHLQGQKTPAAAESPGEKKRPDPLHRFRCRRVPHPHLHHRSGGGRKRGAGLRARHPWQGKAEAPAWQGRPAGRGRRGRCIVLQCLRDALGAEAGAAPARPEGRQITYTDLYNWGLSGTPGSAERNTSCSTRWACRPGSPKRSWWRR